MANVDSTVVRRLKQRIEHLEEVIARTQPIIDAPFEALGAFATGRSNRPKSLDRMVDRENNRRAEAFKKNQEARKSLDFYKNRLALYEAGEVNEHGQPKANAPSRLKKQGVQEQYAEFMRWRTKVGDKLALVANPRNCITAKRVNRKSVTSESGSVWTYAELLPLSKSGEVLSAEELRAEINTWQINAKA